MTSGFATYLGTSFAEQVPATEEAVRAMEEEWGHRLPEDHRAFLLSMGSYDGPLLDGTGNQVLDQFRLFAVEDIDEELGYAVFEDEPGLLPVAGMDAWRYCLRARENGIDYIDLDLGSGDVLAECGATLAELLAFVVATRQPAVDS